MSSFKNNNNNNKKFKYSESPIVSRDINNQDSNQSDINNNDNNSNQTNNNNNNICDRTPLSSPNTINKIQDLLKQINTLTSALTPTDRSMLQLLKRKIDSSLKKWHAFLQASLVIEGVTLEEFLNNHSCENRDELSIACENLNIKSYSAHILSSLLIIPTDYKPDDLMVDEFNRLVGIDNDRAFECGEIKRLKGGEFILGAKNILYTLKPLMKRQINNEVVKEFIQHHPNLLLLKWLISLHEKEKTYETLIKISTNLEINNAKNEINLPLRFHKGWITSMLHRFKLIIKTLKSNPKVSHQQLFKIVHPLASLYFKLTSKEIENPQEQIFFIYENNKMAISKEINLEFKHLLNKYSNILPRYEEILNQLNSIEILPEKLNIADINKKPDLMLSTTEAIKELLLISKVEDFDCPIEFLKLVLQFINNNPIEINNSNNNNDNDNNIKAFKFHESWIESNYIVLINLLQNGIETELIKTFIKYTSNSSILHSAIKSKNQNICNQIQFLVDFGEDINRVQEKVTPLDLAAQMGQFHTFIKIIELGGGLNANNENIKNYYNTLSHGQKCQLKPLIENHLFHVNPKLVWEISLDYLLPTIKDESIDDSNKKRIIIGTLNKRLISEKHCKKLFNSNGQPNKPIQWGKRSVILISKKKYGLGIYFKFKPQFPGIEFAVGSLSELLFGSYTHSNELVLINGEPVLLSQQVYGTPIKDSLQKDPSILNQIDKSNLSKQIVLAILVNNADGNLGNFIISPTSNPNINRLISIDNDQSFVHSTHIYENYFKKKEILLKIHTILFLVDEMFEQVHKDVIDSIINLDIEKLFQDWVDLLMEHHNVTIHLLKCNSKKFQIDEDTLIGVPFTIDTMKTLSNKINRIQRFLKKEKPITHLELLTVLDPLLAIKYKPFLYNTKISTFEKFIQLKQSGGLEPNELSTSSYGSRIILESRDIPSLKNFQNELFNGKYRPETALSEIKQHFSTIDQNCSSIDSTFFRQFKLDVIIKIDLSGCSNLTSFGDNDMLFHSSSITLPSLTHFRASGCNKLGYINIISTALKILDLSYCPVLRDFSIVAPYLESLNLSYTILKPTVSDDIFKCYKKLKDYKSGGRTNNK
ncbi:hypothetical protein ACTA71_010295 [Dictyostelium dimigraforme]